MKEEYELSSLGSRSWHYYEETGEKEPCCKRKEKDPN